MKKSLVMCVGIASIFTTHFSSAAVTIPYGNSAYLYPGDYDHGAQGPNNPGPNNPVIPGYANANWTTAINNFNAAAAAPGASGNNYIMDPYPYVSDLEMGCQSFPDVVSSGSIQLLQPTCTLTAPGSSSDAAAGYFYGVAAPYKTTIGDQMKGMVASYASNLTIPSGQTLHLEGIVDGRIDNAYLQGFNSLTSDEAKGFADYVANGGGAVPASFQSYVADPGAVGICDDSNLAGVQMDLEPFDIETSSDAQASFYTELGSALSKCSTPKWYSVFTFAEKLTPAAIAALNASKNVYVVDSLYDLPYNNNAPITLSVASDGSFTSATYCNSVSASAGCNTAVPIPLNNYQTNVVNEIHNMFKVAVTNNLPFKFAIPAAGSAHEFMSWYKRAVLVNESQTPTGQAFDKITSKANAKADPLDTTPVYQSCNEQNTTAGQNNNGVDMLPGCGSSDITTQALPLLGNNTDPNISGQLDYVKTAITTIECAFAHDENGPAAKQLFKGLSLWEFSSPGTEWSPNPSVVDWNSGYISLGTYVLFSPATIVETDGTTEPTGETGVMAYLEQNLDVLDAATPASCPTFPVDPTAGSQPAPTNVQTDIECTKNISGAGNYSCTGTVTWDQSQGNEVFITSNVGIPAAPTTLPANKGATGNTGTFDFTAQGGGASYKWFYYAGDSSANTESTTSYGVGIYTTPATSVAK